MRIDGLIDVNSSQRGLRGCPCRHALAYEEITARRQARSCIAWAIDFLQGDCCAEPPPVGVAVSRVDQTDFERARRIESARGVLALPTGPASLYTATAAAAAASTGTASLYAALRLLVQ